MKPDFAIKTQDSDLSEFFKKSLISLTVIDERGSRSDSFEIQFDNSDGFRIPSTGTDLVLYLGYENDLAYMGQYRVDDVGLDLATNVMSLKATASRKRSSYFEKRNTSIEGLNLKQLVEFVAARNLFEARVSDELAQYKLSYLVVRNQSDSDLMARMAERFGVTIKPVDGKLLGVEGDLKTVSGLDIEPLNFKVNDFDRANVKLLGRRQVDAVRARYFDVDAGSTVWITEGDDGGKVLQIDEPFANEEEARQAASARLRKDQRKNYSMRFQMPGNAGVRYGVPVKLSGHSDPRIAGDWQIEKAMHSLTESGFISSGEMITPKKRGAIKLS